jgi:SAM-dependent methyltransferase
MHKERNLKVPKSYRAVQHWNHWLKQSLGSRLLNAELSYLPSLLTDYYKKHALLIGVPHQIPLLTCSSVAHQVLIGPVIDKHATLTSIESTYYDLPIASASIDLVLLPHTLEYADNPHKLLSEACRVVKMEGLIVIFNFNPYSLWGLKKKLMHHKGTPWSGNFISTNLIKQWLSVADFELIKQDTLFFRPPLQEHNALYDRLKFMEWMGSKCWKSLGGVNMIMAQAKGIPLMPIKMHWKQQLSGVRASFSGPSMGNWR